MAKNTLAKVINMKRNSGTVSVSAGGGTGGGAVDTSGFLLLDGTRAMTGIFNVGGFAITNVGNVDGVDISAHAANVNAHHNQIHVLANTGGLGSDHTISGGVAGYVLRVTGTTTAAIAQLQHSDLGGVTADQHHNQVHDITSSDHTWAGKAVLSLVGVPTTTGVLGTVTPSNAPGATSAVLKTSSAGQLTIKQLVGSDYVKSSAYVEAASYVDAGTYVTTPRITHTASLLINPTNDITLEPGVAATLQDLKTFKSASAVSGWTGSGFMLGTVAGGSYAELDNLTVRGTMRVYELIIQRIRATNGAIAVTSTGKCETASFSSPNWVITCVEDHGFLEGDLIRAQAFNGSSTGAVIYRSDLTIASVTGPKTFVATKRTGSTNPGPGMEFVRIGNASNTTRQGLLYLTADETFGPYLDVVNDVNSFTKWESATSGKVKLRLGNLEGVTAVPNEYGFIATDGVYTSGNTSSTKWIRASNNVFELRNVGITLWDSGTERVSILSNGTFKFKDASGAEKLSWNGSTLSVDGSGTFSGSISASSGAIGGWLITSSQISNSTGRIKMVSGGDGIARLELYHQTAGLVEYGAGIVSRASATGVAIWAGKPFTDIGSSAFQVKMDGTATMTNAIIKNGSSPTMQIDNNGIHFVPTTSWVENTGFLFKTVIGTGTTLGGLFGQYLASNNFSTGIFANTLDTANPILSTIDANIYIASVVSGATKLATAALQSTHTAGFLAQVLTAVDNTNSQITLKANTLVSNKGGTNYTIWDDSNTSAVLKTTNTNITITGTGYLQTAQKLGAAWTQITFSTTNLGTATGAVYGKKFADIIYLKGQVRFSQPSAQTNPVVVASADWPAAWRGSGEILFNVFLDDGSSMRFTIPASGNVTVSTYPANSQTKDWMFDGISYSVS